MQSILVTGGAGFIGSNFVKYLNEKYCSKLNIVVLDLLTYAADMNNLKDAGEYVFVKGNICDYSLVTLLLETYNIDTIVNFAAESHVDNSIKNPFIFTKTNVLGTHCLLEAAKNVWGEGSNNRFVQISTDEVYGTLSFTDEPFRETRVVKTSSPYSASKAAAERMVEAYAVTFKMNTCITRCSNNYGPNQNEEKLIPHMINLALQGKQLPVYGTGENIRDWLYVMDHCSAIDKVLQNGKPGELYNIGGNSERSNNFIVKLILNKMVLPESRITYVTDRKGHDLRYAINHSKLTKELGWKPEYTFEKGMEYTINHYIEKFKK